MRVRVKEPLLSQGFKKRPDNLHFASHWLKDVPHNISHWTQKCFVQANEYTKDSNQRHHSHILTQQT